MDKRFFLALTLIFVVRGSFADQNYIPSGSMEPTLQVGDHLLVNKLAYDVHLPYSRVVLAHVADPQRGDVIVFHRPSDEMRLVKRLIALPGDHVRIENGFVWINDDAPRVVAIDKQSETLYQDRVGAHHVTLKRTRAMFRPDHFDFIVPAGQYFAMGDNRDNSYDSRGWGFIPRDHLEGRAVGVTYNLAWDLPPKIIPERAVMRVN